jgi:hypothetical protein
MSWTSPLPVCHGRLRFGVLIAGLLALTLTLVIETRASASPTTCEPKPGTSITDDENRTFYPLYSCSTHVDSAVYGNPTGDQRLDDSGHIKAATDVAVVCQKKGRANPVIKGNKNTWWLYTKAEEPRENLFRYANGWGYLPATAVSQGGPGQKVPGVPVCQPPPPPLRTPPPPPPPSGCSDCDGDGYPSTVDCNDRLAAVNPGSADIAGNGLDEDCSGSAAPFQPLDSTIRYNFRYSPRNTVFTELAVRTARAGSTYRIKCTGRGCRFKTKKGSVKKDTRRLNLLPIMRRAKLRPGARLEIRVTRPAMIGVVRRFAIRANKRPTLVELCLTPGKSRPTRCEL